MALRWRGPHRSRLLLASCTAAALTVSVPADAEDVAAADGLFNRGVQQMKAGKYDEACPAIAESQRIDPRPGTLFTLAECEAKQGRIATAMTHYRDFLDLFARMPPDQQARQRTREGIARKQKAALEPKVPELTLTLSANAPRGTVVKRDGILVPNGALGAGLPIDPGEHVVSVQAPEGPLTEVRVTLVLAEKKSLVLDAKAAPVMADPDDAANTGPTQRRIGAYITGGVGLAGLAVGALAGGLTLAKKGTIQDNCGIGGVKTDCNHVGKTAADAARLTGLVSTAGFVVGLAGLGTAVVLWVTEPATPRGSASDDTRLAAAYATGGVGLGALLFGGVLGGMTLAKKGTIQANCGIGGVQTDCNQAGKDAADSAQVTGLLSTVCIGVGLAGLGTAATLLLTRSLGDRGGVKDQRMQVGLLTLAQTGAVTGLQGVW